MCVDMTGHVKVAGSLGRSMSGLSFSRNKIWDLGPGVLGQQDLGD